MRAQLLSSSDESWRANFSLAAQPRLEREQKAAEDRRKSLLSSLTEEIRQLLLETVYVELALAANRDLFDEAVPLDFSEQAYQRLRRHKVPFAGALKLVGTGLPRPRADDALYLRWREAKKDVLTRSFDAIRSRMSDRLRELMEAKKRMDQPPAKS